MSGIGTAADDSGRRSSQPRRWQENRTGVPARSYRPSPTLPPWNCKSAAPWARLLCHLSCRPQRAATASSRGVSIYKRPRPASLSSPQSLVDSMGGTSDAVYLINCRRHSRKRRRRRAGRHPRDPPTTNLSARGSSIAKASRRDNPGLPVSSLLAVLASSCPGTDPHVQPFRLRFGPSTSFAPSRIRLPAHAPA